MKITSKFLFLAASAIVTVATTQAAVVAHYAFDAESAPGTFADSSVNGGWGDGTAAGDAAVDLTTSAFGAGSVSLDGTGDWVQAASSVNPGSLATWSYSIWFNTDLTSGTTQTIGGYFSANKYNVTYTAAGDISLRTDTTGDAATWDTGLDYSANAWHQLVLTSDGSSIAAYFDGGLLADAWGTGKETEMRFESFGEKNENVLFSGNLDEAWVFDTALTASEVTGLYDSNDIATVPEPSSSAFLGLGGLALILRRRK